jgi:hypothetical protein
MAMAECDNAVISETCLGSNELLETRLYTAEKSRVLGRATFVYQMGEIEALHERPQRAWLNVGATRRYRCHKRVIVFAGNFWIPIPAQFRQLCCAARKGELREATYRNGCEA